MGLGGLLLTSLEPWGWGPWQRGPWLVSVLLVQGPLPMVEVRGLIFTGCLFGCSHGCPYVSPRATCQSDVHQGLPQPPHGHHYPYIDRHPSEAAAGYLRGRQGHASAAAATTTVLRIWRRDLSQFRPRPMSDDRG